MASIVINGVGGWEAKQEIKEERDQGRVGVLEGGRERNTKAAISAAVAAVRGKQWARDIGERERER